MSEVAHVGQRIKAWRQRSNLTLKQIESRVQVSATHVSEIERGKTSPTVGALERIARALEVDPALFLAIPGMPSAVVVRAGERRSIRFENEGYRVEPLSAGLPDQNLSVGLAEWEPHFTSGPHHVHAGEEFCLVLAGQLEVEVHDRVHQLQAGDSFHFCTDLPHRVSNPHADPCRALWAATPKFGI